MQPWMKFDVRRDTRRIVAAIRADREHINAAQTRALNRTGEQVRTQAGRIIRAEYNVTLRGVRQASRVKKAKPKARFPQVEVIFSGRPINLFEFGARQNKQGVTVKVKVKGGRKLVKGAFITTIKGGQNAGKKGVFRREGKARYPIKFLPSLSIPTMTEQEAVATAVLTYGGKRYEVNLQQQLRFFATRR